MSSGIGAYAPRYMQTGGGVIGEVVDEVNSMTSGLDAAQGGNTSGRIPLTFEQFMANATTGPGGLIDGKTKEQAYQAYLSVFYGGVPGFTGGVPGFQGGANTQALPDYLTVDGSLVGIAPTATNLQFINFLNDLGLFSDKKYDGKTDYEWFVEATKDNPDRTWISQLFNDPNKDFVVDGDFATRSGYSETNLERFRRLANLINPASQSGGVFQAPQTFLNKYGGGLGLNVNRGDTQAARPRQVFIGQRPTGLGLDPNTGQPSVQQPYYTQADVLVDSTEQPNLYTYNINPTTGVGQFDPMNVTTSVNPYDTAATALSTSYTAPTTTTPFESNVDFSQIFGNVVTPEQVRVYYRMYLGRDPGNNQYVMQFVNSGKTLDQIETEIMNSPEAQNFKITGVPVSSAEELAQIIAERNAVTPEKVRAFYQQYLGRDPGNNEFVMGWVNSGLSLADVEAEIAASAEAQNFATTGVAAVTPTPPAVTLEAVQGLYQKNLGRLGDEKYVMDWVNSGMSLAEIDEAIQNTPEGLAYASSLAGTAPADTTVANTTVADTTVADTTQTVTGTIPADTTTVDTTQTVADTSNITGATTNEEGVPVGETGLTTTQAAILAMEEQAAAEAAAEAAAASTTTPPVTNTVGLSTPAVAGVTLTTDGVVQNNPAASTTSNPNAGRTLTFDDFYKTGFATGGIVDLTDGMNLEANSGQGLESFLRSRSKAALRRNLAKVAPRPTMQTGIMPMAR